jgi:hypothetical protein
MTTSHTADPACIDEGYELAIATLTEHLTERGWTVARTRKGVRARWRWLRVDVRYRRRRPDAPWRVRVRDGVPRVTVYTSYAASADVAALRGAAYAARVVNLCRGSGLLANPSKEDLAHRLWQAVRPF